MIGRTDVPLSEQGMKQVNRLGQHLASEDFDRILCSDLKRTRSTAEAIAASRELDVEYMPDLREIHFGEMEGLGVHEMAGKFPSFDWWADGDFDKVAPGGESMLAVIGRVNAVLSTLDLEGQERVFIVSHGALLRVLFCVMLGMGPRYVRRFRLDVASVSVIETSQRGAALALLNDTHHLDGLAS
jgi:broad specificity phosphatase PhoE